MSLGIVFPGQGSQSIGMLGDIAAQESLVTDTFAEASAVLGIDLWGLCQQGPEEALNATENTQPAMLAAGVALWRVWRHRGGPAPAIMAGHSLGEFTALVCANALDFAAAVELVRFRGQAMQRAVPLGSGAMAAVLGLDDAAVEAACLEAAQGDVVEPVNYNSPGQLVIAGGANAVARAIDACKSRGAKRAVLLPVSVPSHSSLMRPAALALRERLSGVDVRVPELRVLAFDGGEHDSPAAIRDGLYRQLFNPVRWSTVVARMIGAGMQTVIECGPGKVLTGLVRRAEGGRNVNVHALEDAAALNAAIAHCQGESK
jgi:[acyl-carrier-protein] S-malonyltransferase